MGKLEKLKKIPREVTERDVSCLENLVVAYNTVFLMSTIFILSIASTTYELFSDIYRFVSPSALLLIAASFMIFISGLGYVAVAKRSESLISLYAFLLVFVFVAEIVAGLGILSFRGEIKYMVNSKMRKAMMAYDDNPMTANLVDYVQLEMRCCGVNSYFDWIDAMPRNFTSNCVVSETYLPQSCCRKINSTIQEVNRRGCLSALNFILHRSSLLLSLTLITVCIIQILGAYFTHSLSSTLRKFKIQKTQNSNNSFQNRVEDYSQQYPQKSHYI